MGTTNFPYSIATDRAPLATPTPPPAIGSLSMSAVFVGSAPITGAAIYSVYRYAVAHANKPANNTIFFHGGRGRSTMP